MRKDTAQAAANARIAQQKADKIKADAQAKADAQNTASDAKLIARGKRIADQQADAKADAQNTASDAKLIARGKEIADQQAATKADAQNTASDAKLIALAKAFSDAAKDAKTSKQDQASDEKLIALARAQADADRDAAIQAKKQADLDAQEAAKDAQAQRDAEQAQRDAEQQQQQQQQDQQQQQQQQDRQQQQDLTPVVLPKLTRRQQNTRAQSKIMTKKQVAKKANKAIRSPRGDDKPAPKRNLKLHPFTPLTMPDPMNLSRYKSFGESTHRKNNMKNLQEGYKIMPPMDPKYTERSGLEGPFTTLSGKVVYYDPKEGKYYDPDTDMYMSYDEFQNYDKDYSGMKDERDEVGETLSPEEKKQVNQMYNKDGTMTDIGNKVMRQGQIQDILKKAMRELKRIDAEVMFRTRDMQKAVATIEQGNIAGALQDLVNGVDGPENQIQDTFNDAHDTLQRLINPKTDKELDDEYWADVDDMRARNRVGEEKTLKGVMSKVFDNARREFEFNPRAGHRDQPSHPENRGLTPEYPEINVRPKARPTSSAPKTSLRPKPRPANLQMRNDINKAVQQAMGEVDGKKYKVSEADYDLSTLDGKYGNMPVKGKEGILQTNVEDDVNDIAATMEEDPELENFAMAFEKSVYASGDTSPEGIRAALEEVLPDYIADSRIEDLIKVIEGVNEGKMSDSIIDDSETMSKEEFAKKYGAEMANEYYESIAAQNVLDNSILAKENVDKLRKIVSDKSMMPIKFNDGTMNVDMTTANIFVKAFDKMKETNQSKVSEMIKTKAGFLRVMDIIYGAMK